MKKLITIAFCLFICLTAFGQETSAPEGSKAYYMQKSKTNKKTAEIMLGSGLIVTAVALGTYPGGLGLNFCFSNDCPEYNTTVNDIAVVMGLFAIVGSVIPFREARRNKRKAAAVEIGFQEIIPLPDYGKFGNANIPAVRVSIRLN